MFPMSERKADSRFSWFWTALVVVMLYVFIPAGIGFSLIWIFELFILLGKLDGHWTSEIFVLLFYLVGLVLLFFIMTAWQAGREFLRGVDHGIHRLLSIGVVGISDLFFRGRAGAALSVYIFLFIFQVSAGCLVTLNLIESDLIKSLLAVRQEGKLLSNASVFEIFKAGFALIYGLLFLVFPFLSVAIPRWNSVVQRPVLNPIDENLLTCAKGEGRCVKVAHLSDLHLHDFLGKDDETTARALNAADECGVEVIALTGDLTDKGSSAAWRVLINLPKINEKDSRIVMVPGNHDLNTWNVEFWESFFTIDSYRRTEAHRRAYLYLQVVSQVMGARTWVICPFTGALRRLSAVIEQAGPKLRAWDEDRSQSILPADFLHSLYPMLVETASPKQDSGVGCLVWNTVKGNRWALLNSIGELGPDQVKRGEKILAHQQFSELPLIHMMHHQIAVPRKGPTSKHPKLSRKDEVTTVGMGLQSAEHLLGFIRKRSQRTIILHGHHHKYFVCHEPRSGATIVSCPSSKFGTEVSYSKNVPADDKPNWLLLHLSIDKTNVDLTKIEPM